MRIEMYKKTLIYILLFPFFMSCNFNGNTEKDTETSVDSLGNLTDTHVNAAGFTQMELDTLAAWLRESVLEADLEFISKEQRKFSAEKYDLNGDGKPEYFIALQSDYFCGSGGCTYYILNYDGTVNSRFSGSNVPFQVLSTQSHGWHNIIINSSQGQHILEFDGQTYPENPDILVDFQKEQAINGTTVEGLVLEDVPMEFDY